MELKPCPFCGCKKEIRTSEHGMWGVHCICGASIYGYDNAKQAIDAWNTRIQEKDKAG